MDIGNDGSSQPHLYLSILKVCFFDVNEFTLNHSMQPIVSDSIAYQYVRSDF